jgi:hypothetical protein
MSTQRFIHCVGTSEEDTTHIRLLLRLVQTQVSDGWAWGAEAKADLVIVDTRRVVGDTALRRAGQRGIPCVRIIDEKEPTPGGLFLRKPLQRDAFAALLARVESGSVDTEEPEASDWDSGIADLDWGMIDLSALEADHPGAQLGYGPPTHAGETHTDLELAEIADLSAHLIDMVATATTVAGSEPDRADEVAASGAAHVETSSAADAKFAQVEEAYIPREVIDPNATFPLVYYLEKGVLEGPSRIVLPRRGPLVIDPATQMFWAQDSLSMLEPYFRELLRFGDWERLDGMELERARGGMAVRPFKHLIWLDAFVHSNGFLARRYNMNGDFRLTNRIDLSADYPQAVRVTTCMSGAPKKLHEISRDSGVGLEQVCDIINAYDALGYVEGTRR